MSEVDLEGTVQVMRISELMPADIVVYSTPKSLSEADAASVMKLLQGMFPKNKIALVDEGAKIEVVRP